MNQQLETIDRLDRQIEDCEQKLEVLLGASAERDLLKTLPGVGKILSAAILLEIGDISRFATAQNLASYAGERRQKAPGKMPRRLQHVSEMGLYRGRQRGRGAS